MPRIFAAACAAALCLSVGLSGCSNTPSAAQTLTNTLSPYQPDVLQGNVITREQVQALQVGMERNQVVQILGTPLLQSVFHAQRWDYVFSFQRQGQAPQQRRLTLYFEGPRLARFEGDEMPSETEFVQAIARPSASVAPDSLQASEQALDAFAKKNPAPSAEATPEAQPKPAYPPLQAGGGLLQ